MARWHVDASGEPRVCRARSADSCPLVTNDESGLVRHFRTKKEALAYGEWVAARNAVGASSDVDIINNASTLPSVAATAGTCFRELNSLLSACGLMPVCNAADVFTGGRSRVYSVRVSSLELPSVYDCVRGAVDRFNKASALMVVSTVDGPDSMWEWRNVDVPTAVRACRLLGDAPGLTIRLSGQPASLQVYAKQRVNPRYLQALMAVLDDVPSRTPVRLLEVRSSFSDGVRAVVDRELRHGGTTSSDVIQDMDTLNDWLGGQFDDGDGDSSTGGPVEGVRTESVQGEVRRDDGPRDGPPS